MREALKAGIVSVGRPGMGQFGVYGGTQRIPRVDQSVSRCRACACGVASLAGRPEQVIHIVCRPAVCCHGPDRGELVWEEVDDSSGRVVHTRSKIPRRQKSCGDGEHCLLGRTSRGRDERRNRVWKGDPSGDAPFDGVSPVSPSSGTRVHGCVFQKRETNHTHIRSFRNRGSANLQGEADRVAASGPARGFTRSTTRSSGSGGD